MNVLIACEFSGTVRRAFDELGHNAWSCDILPAEDGHPNHYQGDVLDILHGMDLPTWGDVEFSDLSAKDREAVNGGYYAPDRMEWDLMIAHPPCTHLAVSGARWFKDKLVEQAEALRFVQALLDAPIERIALENPVSIISSRIRKPDQIIQPWMFGHGETKATCLWLKNLPKLAPMSIVEGREQRVWKMPPSPDRWKERSRTFPGIATAMAMQWGGGKIVGKLLESGRILENAGGI